MMRLLSVELDRYRSRRLNQVAALGMVGLVALMLLSLWSAARPPSAADQASMEENLLVNQQYWDENHEADEAQCLADREADPGYDPTIDYGCSWERPTAEMWFGLPSTFETRAETLVSDVGLGFLMLAFVVGVSFVAAEFGTGAMGNWLTFEPRRTRVYASKVAAAALGVIPAAVVGVVLLVAGAWLVFSHWGTLGDVTGDVWAATAVSGLRLVLAVVGFSALGVALGTLMRNTAAAVGVLVAYVVVVEGIVRGQIDGFQTWFLQLNLSAVLSGVGEYWYDVCTSSPQGRVCEGFPGTVSLTHGALVLTAVVAVVVVVAGLVFRRRDVS